MRVPKTVSTATAMNWKSAVRGGHWPMASSTAGWTRLAAAISPAAQAGSSQIATTTQRRGIAPKVLSGGSDQVEGGGRADHAEEEDERSGHLDPPAHGPRVSEECARPAGREGVRHPSPPAGSRPRAR